MRFFCTVISYLAMFDPMPAPFILNCLWEIGIANCIHSRLVQLYLRSGTQLQSWLNILILDNRLWSGIWAISIYNGSSCKDYSLLVLLILDALQIWSLTLVVIISQILISQINLVIINPWCFLMIVQDLSRSNNLLYVICIGKCIVKILLSLKSIILLLLLLLKLQLLLLLLLLRKLVLLHLLMNLFLSG